MNVIVLIRDMLSSVPDSMFVENCALDPLAVSCYRSEAIMEFVAVVIDNK